MLNSLTVFGKDALWWGMVWMGCYVAYQQGWLPFLQPPNPRPEHANARAAAREQAAAAAAAETEEQPAVPEDPVSQEEHKAAMDALMARAQEKATQMNDKKLTVEHMILALAGNPRFMEILQCAEGMTEDHLKSAIKKSRIIYNRGEVNEDLIPEHHTAMSKYSRDLTQMARQGNLDPVIGRSDEIRRVIHILSRRTKNNPVILGEPGVGKTALVEGLAQRVAAGDVPETLRDVAVVALDMGLLMAGAFMPGEFEERLKAVLKELTEPNMRTVLFIDDLHNVMGPNAQQGGGMMDASVLLKPLLGRGELRCIGATSPDKFKKFIEKDPALERRFQQVNIDPPSSADTVSILRGLRARLERHHGVRISDSALSAAATLSDRYITDRYLPDKALDLVDEAGARARVEASLKPELLDRVERRIAAMEGDRRLLRRSAPHSKPDELALEELEIELKELRSQRADMFEKYQVEKSEACQLNEIQDEIDRLTDEIENLEEAGDTQNVAKLTNARRGELVKKMRATQQASLARRGGPKGRSLLVSHGEVTEADVARVISTWTGIPLTKLVESEVDKVLHLSDELHRRIVGQHEAVVAVAEAIQRSRAGMKDPNGPISSFLFLGQTGVGKTELAKALAQSLFSTEESMIRLDMSEFMEKHAVSKLIGAPPGYVGFDEGGQLTEKVRHKPYCVILFDEVEKAHVDVFNVLLQILDDGRVTDGQGRLVSFKNAIIIMTSNLGSAEMYREHSAAVARRKQQQQQQHQEAGPESLEVVDKERMKEVVMEQVRKHFRPEFVNRVDEFIIFEPLRANQMAHIVNLRLRGVVSRLAEKRIRLAMTPSAINSLAVRGFDPIFGGRPVKRVIQRELETPLARALLSAEFQEEDAVVVGLGDSDQLTFVRVPQGATHAGAQALEAAMAATEKGRGGNEEKGPAASLPQQNGEGNQASSNGGRQSGKKGGGKGGQKGGQQGQGGKDTELKTESGDGEAGSGSAPTTNGTDNNDNAPKAMPNMGSRPLKFDPLKKISAMASSGEDITKDGHAARADPDSLPTSSGS